MREPRALGSAKRLGNVNIQYEECDHNCECSIVNTSILADEHGSDPKQPGRQTPPPLVPSLSSAQLASMLRPQKIVTTRARLLTILLQLVLMSLYAKGVRCRSDWVEQVLIFLGQVIV
jgi:hypothetical protein